MPSFKAEGLAFQILRGRIFAYKQSAYICPLQKLGVLFGLCYSIVGSHRLECLTEGDRQVGRRRRDYVGVCVCVCRPIL